MPHLDTTKKVDAAKSMKPPNFGRESSKTEEVRGAGTSEESDRLLSLSTMALRYDSNQNVNRHGHLQAESGSSGHLPRASQPQAFLTREGKPPSENGQPGKNPVTPSPYIGPKGTLPFYGHEGPPGWRMRPPMMIQRGPDGRSLFPSPIRGNVGASGAPLGTKGPKMSPITMPPGILPSYSRLGHQNDKSVESGSLDKRNIGEKRPLGSKIADEPPLKKTTQNEEGKVSPKSVAGHVKDAEKAVISPTPSVDGAAEKEPERESQPKEPIRERFSSDTVTDGASGSLQRYPLPYSYYAQMGTMYGPPGMYFPPYCAAYRPIAPPPLPNMYPSARHRYHGSKHPCESSTPGARDPKAEPSVVLLSASLDEASKIPEQALVTRRVSELPADEEPKLSCSAKVGSVSEWQSLARATGSPPSTGRCVELKDPVPTQFWGDSKSAQTIEIPDFHRLVNFPDYLAKNKLSSLASATAHKGKRHCVMCGKLRFCSGNNNIRNNPQEEDHAIIPRQNKGLCTACDVTIWVLVDQKLEIKWCKGCKNFRHWGAFGDKGRATKCVRCRERQREKYATQKEQLRIRRIRDKQLLSQTPNEEEKKDDDGVPREMAAANGLRNLMSAAL